MTSFYRIYRAITDSFYNYGYDFVDKTMSEMEKYPSLFSEEEKEIVVRYKKLLKECGVSKLHFHALRHTFATRCIEAGVDVKTLSEILGHSNVSITLNTYVHPSMDNKRIQIEKLCALTA